MLKRLQPQVALAANKIPPPLGGGEFIKNFSLNIDDKYRIAFIEHINNIKNKTGKGKKKYINQEIEKIIKTSSALLEEIDKNLSEEQKLTVSTKIKKLHKLLDDQIKARKNLCSIHEPGVACIAKGKDGKNVNLDQKHQL